MSEHKAAIAWRRDGADFDSETYPRDHEWSFPGGVAVPASAAPDFKGNPSRVNPEEALVATIAGCHMLTLLAVAAKKRWTVDRYDDDPVGVLEKNSDGRMAVTRITLRPRIEFSGERRPTEEQIAALHETAHKHCFIANSVKTEVTVEPARAPVKE
jgi:organic hydroperoxide reductase OsmC/OhrA